MRFTLLNVGKTDNSNLESLISDYVKRINIFVPFRLEFVLPPRKLGKYKPEQVKKLEGELILRKCSRADFIILLDDKGKTYNSVDFSIHLQKILNMGFKNVYFISGGAYGFSDEVYNKSNEKLSLSRMTTTHQIIRLSFAEQFYRAFTIIKGHPYHNN